ncbi:hypothetical protein [Deinococcus sp. 6GRE01]|uniref:hypothetical protein n=1 Tax=Deinococcus sp. 6GRE01 TaxID=2745873 RepID=UPI001E48B08F|nr:hypothetical protein [Deinococcus sp. 6GRE01]MCD0156258.1 hypothetical protein [Deinococcus sp. 6GRE01]
MSTPTCRTCHDHARTANPELGSDAAHFRLCKFGGQRYQFTGQQTLHAGRTYTHLDATCHYHAPRPTRPRSA